MNKSLKTICAASAAAFVFSLSAHATNYAGNGSTSFGGPIGNGMLALNSSGGTVTGTITPGLNNGAGNLGQIYDELVMYISTTGTTGFTSTSTLTDHSTTDPILAGAVSGYNGTTRATINFATGFAAMYAISISPNANSGVGAGELYRLTAAGAFTAVQSINLTPSSGPSANYTFSFSLANIGNPARFNFSTTYLNAHSDLYRSAEAFNTVTDTTTPTNTGNIAQDTATLGVNTFITGLAVPEPSTWAMMVAGAGLLIGFQRRLRRQA